MYVLTVPLWVYSSMIQFKTRNYTHGKVTMFAFVCGRFPSPSLLVAADNTILLQLTLAGEFSS